MGLVARQKGLLREHHRPLELGGMDLDGSMGDKSPREARRA